MVNKINLINKKIIKYLIIITITIIILSLIVFINKSTVKYFQYNTINLYNNNHLGDSLYTMIYFYNIKDYIIKNNITIHFYINSKYIKEVNEFIPCNNIKIYDILLRPYNSIDTWIDSLEELDYYTLLILGKMPYNNFLTSFFSKFGSKINLPGLKELKYEDTELLSRYEKLDNKYKNIDILILNSFPKSNQYEYDKNKWDIFINKLNKKYNIVVSEYVKNILCTRDNNLLIKDIAALSTHVKYVIAINSGPLASLFNTYTYNSVNRWYIFDKYCYFSLNNFINAKGLDEIERDLL